MNRVGWAITLLAIGFAAASADAQERPRAKTAEEREARTYIGLSSAGPSTSADNDDTLFDDLLGNLAFVSASTGTSCAGAVVLCTALAPFYLPIAFLGDDHQHTLQFAPYPYANRYRGYQLLEPLWHGTGTDVLRRNWVGRVSVENGNDGAGLNRFNGQLRLEHANRFGIVTNWNYFSEYVGRGRSADATIGDTNVIYRFAQSEVASVYAGLGFRVLADHWHTRTGVNFTYGGEWFPVRPLVVSSVLDIGTLGNTSVFHARSSLGAIINGWEFFAGYDFTRIGVTNLQGPMVGARLWF